MRTRIAYPGHVRAARNTLAIAAAVLLGYRLVRASAQSTTDLLTSAATAATLIGAFIAGTINRIRELRDAAAQAAARADIAELEAARARRNAREQEQHEDAEWQRWWAEAREHDTIAFGKVVVPLAGRRVQPERNAG